MPRRATVLLLVTIMGGLASGCGELPVVSRETIRSVAGGDVRIVGEAQDANPTDEWMYTYLLLEVSGPPPRLNAVTSTLTTNGWVVRMPDPGDSAGPFAGDPGPRATADKPGATLTLVNLADFLEPGLFTRPQKAFAEVPRSDGKGYFVAILMPLNG